LTNKVKNIESKSKTPKIMQIAEIAEIWCKIVEGTRPLIVQKYMPSTYKCITNQGHSPQNSKKEKLIQGK
jgi:hypothetical protein